MPGFGSSIKLEGEDAYRKALQEITQNLKELASEMKLVSSEYDANDNSTSALAAKSEVLTKTLAEQESKLSTLRDRYKDMESQYERSSSEHDSLVSSYNEEKSKLSELEKTLGTTSKEYQDQKEVVDKLEQEVKESTDAQGKFEQSMSKARTEINNAETACNKTANEIDNLGKETEDAGNKAEKSAKGGWTVFNQIVANLITDVLKKGAKAIKDFAGSVINTGAEFEASMSSVAAISGATGEEFEALKAKAQEMGETTKFTASESAEALKYMAMAGWKTEEMLNGLEGIMSLAAASGEDLGTTSDIVTDALTAFGLTAADSGHFADVLAAASNNANTNVGMMGETFKYAAPIAGSLGYSIEDVAVAIGLMANSGIKSSMAGTALRKMMTELSGEIEITTDRFNEMDLKTLKLNDSVGISKDQLGTLVVQTTNADGTMREFSEIISDLRSVFNNLTEAERAQIAENLVGKTAMSGFLAIVNATEDDMRKLTAAINDCDGAAGVMSNTMQDNLTGKITILNSAVDGLRLAFYEGIEGVAKSAVDGLKEAVTQLTEKVREWLSKDETQEKLAKISEAIEKIIEALLENLDPILDGIIGLINGIIDVIGFLIEHIDLIVTTIEVLIGVWAGLKALSIITSIVNTIKTVSSLGSAISALAGGPVTLIVAAVAAAAVLIIKHWEEIKNAFAAAWEAIKLVWSIVVDWFKGVANGIMDAFIDIGVWFANVFTAAWNGIQSAWASVVQFFTNIWNAIQSVFSAVAEWFSSIFQAAWEGIQNAWAAVVSFFSGIWEGITGVFNSVAEWFGNIFTQAWNGITSVWDGVTSFFQNIWQSIVDIFTSLPSRMLEIGGDIVRGIWDGISNAATWLWEQLTGWCNGIIDGIKGFFGIHSPSTLFRDEIGENLALGIGEGFADEMKNVSNEMQDAIPTNFDIGASINGTKSAYNGGTLVGNDNMLNTFKTALAQMKIELDDEVAGKFVEKTVARAIYS